LVGIERESVNRPAGFRTHMLVTVGSTLVMMVNGIMVSQYSQMINLDPGRFGAAVISGIGFLGAGTIIKEGNSVKGLTTAASLWTVACIGISVGAGYYLISVITTVVVLVILELFARIERKILKNRRLLILKITSSRIPGQMGRIGLATGKFNCLIQDIDFEHRGQDPLIEVITLSLKYPAGFDLIGLMDELTVLEGLLAVEQVTPL
jgi:putative Mg2+ transporter-C (MgtC) family protein